MGKLDGHLWDYLSKGRQLKALDAAALDQLWFVAVEQAKHAKGQQLFDALQDMNDVEGELQLRDLAPPSPRPSSRPRPRS